MNGKDINQQCKMEKTIKVGIRNNYFKKKPDKNNESKKQYKGYG